MHAETKRRVVLLTKHNLSNTRLYRIYAAMKQRCYNEKNLSYRYYGGKGITICKEWRDDFIKFYRWSMQNGYAEHLTIDRINSMGNYSPENCRWISRSENSQHAFPILEKQKMEWLLKRAAGLKEARLKSNLTPKSMSQRLEIPIKTIEDWEKGDNLPPLYVEKLVIAELKRIEKE